LTSRHACAKNVSVQLSQQETGYHLCIEDDGIGFNPKLISSPNSYGLYDITNTASRLGLELEIQTEFGRGTRIYLVQHLTN